MKKTKKKVVKKASKKKPTRRNTMFGKSKAEVTRLTRELEQYSHTNKMQADGLSDLKRTHSIEKEDWERERKRLSEIETTLKKKFDEEKALAFKTMELEFKGKMQDEVNKVRNEAQEKVQKGIEENFAKLKDSLAKLHEEGNAQTKFTEQIALKMMDSIRPTTPTLTEK